MSFMFETEMHMLPKQRTKDPRPLPNLSPYSIIFFLHLFV